MENILRKICEIDSSSIDYYYGIHLQKIDNFGISKINKFAKKPEK